MPALKDAHTAHHPPRERVGVILRARRIRPSTFAILPCLLGAALYWWPASRVAAVEGPAGALGAAASLRVGNWGALEETTLVISPPLDMIPDEWDLPSGVDQQWYFPGATRDMVADVLAAAGLDADQVSALMASAREHPGSKGIALTPTEAFRRWMPPDIRARLYTQLAGSELNVSQASPFRFTGQSIDEWLGSPLISPATRRIVEPLIYRSGRQLCLADAGLVRAQIKDPDQLRRLAKVLLRQKTSRLRLSVTSLADVPGIAAYWGRGGRRTDIQPLLESVAGVSSDHAIDIVHLLPAFPRTNLYRYPRLTAEDLNRPELANCLWTALNFFNEAPDNRYLDPGTAIESLRRDYYLVHDDFQLGDVVALLDGKGRIFHTASYLADRFVFTKNGYSALAPWVILPLDAVLDFYQLAVEKPKVLYHRRKDF